MISIKKICFLMGSVKGTGGIGRVVSIISSYMSNISDYDLYIVGYSDEPNNDSFSYSIDSKIKIFGLGQKNKSMKKGLINATKILRKFILDNNIDILVSCGALYFPLGVSSVIMNRCKLICWEHSNYYVTSDHTHSKLSRYIGAKFSDKLITLTEKDKNNYLNNINVKSIENIYNPVDPLLIKKDKNYNINSKKIISVGRLTYQKNFECLVDVAKEVLEKNKDWEWHIYGNGEEKDSLQNKINSYNLQDRLILKGRTSNIYDLYTDYSILVMTSRYEGFPMTLIEAMANNIPCVSFDIQCGPSEIIIEGKNGFLVDFNDIDCISNKINTLISDDNLRKYMSSKCRDSLEKLYIENIIIKWNEIFNSL